MNSSTVIAEKEINSKALEKSKNMQKSLEENINRVQEELIQNKLKIGNIMNVVNEECNSEIVEKIYKALGIKEN